VRKAIEIGSQIGSALAAAHARGVIHRDLKPENAFLAREGRVKLLDFGLARLTQAPDDTAERVTRTDTDRGAWMHLEDDVGAALVRPDVVDGEDAGVLEGGDGPRLLLEPVEPLRARRTLTRDDLDRNVAPEPGVPGAVDLPHPSGPEGRDDLVRPQASPRCEAHGVGAARIVRPRYGDVSSRTSPVRSGEKAPGRPKRIIEISKEMFENSM
jgi:serine/threonine protein kinase